MKTLTTALFALSLLTAAPALAQHPEPRPFEGDEASAEQQERARERVRIIRAAALTEALELDEATAAKLFPYLREADEAMEAVHRSKREARLALKQMVEADSYDSKAVDEALAAITEAEVKLAEGRAEMLEGLDRILTAEQRAKFIMVQGKIDREVRRVIREERRRHRGEGRMRGERHPE